MINIRFFTLLIFLVFMLSCSDNKKEEIYPTDIDNAAVTDTSYEDKSLPEVDENEESDREDTSVDSDVSQVEDDKDDVNADSDISTDSDTQQSDADTDDETGETDSEENDDDQVEFCFQKQCSEHEGCSDISCNTGGEKYACAPEIEDFGYRNTGECVEINCEKDSDCRLELGYICVAFGAALAEFNDGSSACLKSIIGESCSEDGKKICQFDRSIALECKDGVWMPDFCETGEVCLEGECVEEVSDSDSELPDTDIEPAQEICDNIDNNGNGQIDEGCDDDGDGWCDINMVVYGTPAVCPNGVLDCNDTDNTIYPGSVIHKEGVDYDCDNRKEYQATVVLSVDDQLVDLCANGTNVTSFGPYYGQWTYVDTYNGQELILESGINVVGIHGIDTGAMISAFIATIEVNGQLIVSDGVLPPDDGIAYTSADPEWSQSEWRYFPTMAEGPNGDWCDKWFDDSSWGPAILAGMDGHGTTQAEWGNLGTYPWTNTSCGGTMCPKEFISYYEDSIADNEPKWIWDYNPTSLADAWLRIKIDLP